MYKHVIPQKQCFSMFTGLQNVLRNSLWSVFQPVVRISSVESRTVKMQHRISFLYRELPVERQYKPTGVNPEAQYYSTSTRYSKVPMRTVK